MSIVITKFPRGMLGLNPNTPFDIKIVSGRRAGQRLSGGGLGTIATGSVRRAKQILRESYGMSRVPDDGNLDNWTWNALASVLGPTWNAGASAQIIAALEAHPAKQLAFVPWPDQVIAVERKLNLEVDTGKAGRAVWAALDSALPDWKTRPWDPAATGNVVAALQGGGGAAQPDQPIVNPTDVTNLTDLNLIRESAVARKATAMAYNVTGLSAARQSARNNAVSQYNWAIQAIDAELKQGSHPAARYQKVVTESRKKITYGDQAMSVAKTAPKPTPDPTTTCPAGTHRVLGICVPDAAPGPEPCPAGTHRVMGVCVADAKRKKDVVVPPPDPQCTAPNVWRDGVCTAPDEPEPGMPWWGWAALAAGVIGVVAGGKKALSGNPLRGVSGHWEDAP